MEESLKMIGNLLGIKVFLDNNLKCGQIRFITNNHSNYVTSLPTDKPTSLKNIKVDQSSLISVITSNQRNQKQYNNIIERIEIGEAVKNTITALIEDQVAISGKRIQEVGSFKGFLQKTPNQSNSTGLKKVKR